MRIQLPHAREISLAACSALVISLLVGAVPARATNLPDGRAYEEVTPVHMGGAQARPLFASADGEKVFYISTGAFTGPSGGNAGVTYEAVRSPSGWLSYELLPSAKEYHPANAFLPVNDFSADFTKSITELASPFESDAEPYTKAWYLQESDGNPAEPGVTKETRLTPRDGEAFEPEGTPQPVVGASPDLKHLFIIPGRSQEGNGQLFEEAEAGTPSQHYQSVGIVGPANSDGTGTFASNCGSSLGTGGGYEAKHTDFHAISPDGSFVVFTANACIFEGGPGAREVMARVNGTETIPISEPTLEYCPGLGGGLNFTCKPAAFEGASYNDSKVFFTTTQAEEVPGVTDTTENLYAAEIGGTSTKSVRKMVQVSAGDTSGEGARVQGVVRISDDGSHVYFVAQGVLTNAASPTGLVAQNGADNLYVNADGTVQFIGEVCSGPQISGAVTDTHCFGSDDGLWNGEDNRPAWAAPFGSEVADGHILVFDTTAQLITSGAEADRDTAVDVYRYDSQTNNLIRVSTGRNGFDDNGNNSNFSAGIPTPNYGTFGGYAAAENGLYVNVGEGGRPVSNDGSFIFFQTLEALEPDDINGAPDTYEWHNGLVSLISDGRNPGVDIGGNSRTANTFVGSSADGRDVFFTTPDTLVPEEGQNPEAIYDARIGGGIPQPIVPPPCREDGCQGSLSATPSFPSPSSALYDSGGNVTIAAAPSVPKVKKATKPAKHGKPKKRGKVKQKHGKRAKSVGKSHVKGRK